MKPAFSHLLYASTITLALGTMVGCTKKDNVEPQAAADIEVAIPEVMERPPITCDDVGLKNRVVSLVRNELYQSAVRTLGENTTSELNQQLKARLSNIEIDLQNLSEADGECHARLHIVLPDQEIRAANKTFASAGLPNLEDQAVENDISLMGGSRLVGNFKFQTDGEALSIDEGTPILALASGTMATASRSLNKQTKANAKRESANIGKESSDIVPAPNVQIRPVQLPSIPQSSTPNTESTAPTDKADAAPSDKNDKADKANKDSKPKSQKTDNLTETQKPKSEPKNEPKAEPKPKPEPEPQPSTKDEPKDKTPNEKPSEQGITIVETDDTY